MGSIRLSIEKPISLPPQRTYMSRFRYLFTKFVTEWWLFELVSWIFSALCMITIIGVLWYYDGKALPRWALGITLNGFISVFSNFAKASLILPTAKALGQLKWNWFREEPKPMLDFEIFDSASRGPWGALLLLHLTRGRALASFGAVVIILALPLELFFQQTLFYPAVWISVQPLPSIARTTTYVPPNAFTYRNGTPTLEVDPYLFSIIEPQFYSNAPLPEIQYSCPTMNCTWEPFDTLAVCSSCSSNVHQLLEFGCYPSLGDWFDNVTYTGHAGAYSNITACGYWLNATSDSRILMTGYALNGKTGAPGEALGMRNFPLVDAFTRQPYYGGSINFANVVNPIVDVLIVGTPGPTSNVYANTTPTAIECVLSWCVQRMKSSFYWGHLQENQTQTPFENETSTGFPWLTKAEPNGKIAQAYLPDIVLEPPSQNSTNRTNERFVMSHLYAEQTVFALDTFAPSFLTMANESTGPLFKFDNKNPPRDRVMTINPWLPPSDASSHMQNLARAMTIAIRNTQNSDGSFELVYGTAWDTENRVEIRWLWMIMPVSLLVCGLVFLLAIIVKSSTQSENVRIWKTSALAILFNGLGEDVQQRIRQGGSMGEVSETARVLMVKLSPD